MEAETLRVIRLAVVSPNGLARLLIARHNVGRRQRLAPHLLFIRIKADGGTFRIRFQDVESAKLFR
jgi:hypothetical protein